MYHVKIYLKCTITCLFLLIPLMRMYDLSKLHLCQANYEMFTENKCLVHTKKAVINVVIIDLEAV